MMTNAIIMATTITTTEIGAVRTHRKLQVTLGAGEVFE